MVRICKYHADKRCYHDLVCSFVDAMGNVGCCPLVSNSDGHFMARRVGLQLHGVFDKHALRRS